MVCSFLTSADIHQKISNMGNKLTLYSIALGDENIFFFDSTF